METDVVVVVAGIKLVAPIVDCLLFSLDEEVKKVELILVEVNELVFVVVLSLLNESDVALILKSAKVIGIELVIDFVGFSKKEVVLLELVVLKRENSVKVEIEVDFVVIIFIDEVAGVEKFLNETGVVSCVEVVELCIVNELVSEVKVAVTTLFEGSVIVIGE